MTADTMDDETKRKLYFMVCLLVRALLTIGALEVSRKWPVALPFLGGGALVIGVLFVVASVRHAEIGFFGGDAWWDIWRRLHAVLWVVAGVTMLSGWEWGAAFAVGDTALGMGVGLYHYG